MSPEDAAFARALLAHFPAPYVLIGSFATWLRGEVELASVHDVDVLVALDAAAIEAMLQHLDAHGFEARIWESAISRPVTLAQLVGKHYVRARRGSLQIDLAFELAHLPFEGVRREAVWLDGLAVCPRQTPRL